MLETLKEGKSSDLMEHEPLILTVDHTKPKVDPIDEATTLLLVDYINLLVSTSNSNLPKGGFKEYLGRHGSSSQVLEKLYSSDNKPKNENSSKGKALEVGNSNNVEEGKNNSCSTSSDLKTLDENKESQKKDNSSDTTDKEILIGESKITREDNNLAFDTKNISSGKNMKTSSNEVQSSYPKSNNLKTYEDHIQEDKAQDLIKSGKLISGKLRVDPKARWEGFVTPNSGSYDKDILIPGYHYQNRALHGDLVAIELFSQEEAHREIKATFNYRYSNMYIKGGTLAGKVVSILNRANSLSFVGTIQPPGFRSNDNDTQEQSEMEALRLCKNAVFLPTSSHFSVVLIPNHDISSIIPENIETLKNHVFEAKITYWSKYERYPFGQLVNYLGTMGDLRTTKRNILINNNIIDEPFTESVLDDLPKLPYEITDNLIKNRLDFRKECVFTIDPSTARDLDDAVSIKKLPNGNFKVGVHIADVSHFISPGSALDKEALKRGTSTYVVNRVIPMLPELLCQDLCSLNPGVDRLTFSVVWELDSEGNRITTSFAKAIIKSCCKLAYEDAQQVIEGGNLPSDLIVYGDHNVSTIEQNIKDLYNLSKIMRKRRFYSCAVQINKPKISIKLDEKGFPESFYTYQGIDSYKLIEEFMLLANMSVAEKIYQEYPSEALMRSNPYPTPRNFTRFGLYTKDIYTTFHGQCSSDLARYLDNVKDITKRSCIEDKASKTLLNRSKYICNTGESDPSILYHYVLNVDHYTHFTSPIRRYPDIIVHRQLMSILTGEKVFNHGANEESISVIAHLCNSTREKSRIVQEQCNQLYLAHYINRNVNLTGKAVCTTGYIFKLDDYCMEVLIPEYGLEKKFKWSENFHFSFKLVQGSSVLLKSYHDTFFVKNKPVLDIDNLPLEKPLSDITISNENSEIVYNKRSALPSQDARLEQTAVSFTFELFKPIPLLLSASLNGVTPRIHIHVDESKL